VAVAEDDVLDIPGVSMQLTMSQRAMFCSSMCQAILYTKKMAEFIAAEIS
jgi:hypothetical protein